MSDAQPMAAEPIPPIKTAWLCFRSEPWKNCDRIIGELEINSGEYKRILFDCVAPEVDGLICESHNLTHLFQPFVQEIASLRERLADAEKALRPLGEGTIIGSHEFAVAREYFERVEKNQYSNHESKNKGE